MQPPGKNKLYQIPVVLDIEAKNEGEVVSIVRQLEKRAGRKRKLPIVFRRIGIGQIKPLREIRCNQQGH